MLAGAGKKLHAYIDRRHRTLGPIFRETLGPAELVFVSCPLAMRELFRAEGKHPKHPLPESWTLYNEAHKCKRGLFFMEDDEWLHNRRLMNSLMLAADNQPHVRAVIERTCSSFADDLRALFDQHQQATSVEIPDLIGALYAWSVHGVSAYVLGDVAHSDHLRPRIGQLAVRLRRLFEHSAPLMSFPPRFAQRWRLPVWTRFERTVSDILAAANEIAAIALDELRANGGPKASSLIAGMVEHGMPEDVIRRIFIDLILAAGDTTAYTGQWALYALARNPNAQADVRSELLHSDNAESALVRSTVRETMRLWPMAFFIGRLLPTAAVIDNYIIPANTMVLASLYTAGRCADNFPDPQQFQPQRWLRDSNGKYASVHRAGASIPYALGARSCIGQKLANTQMHYLLANILRDFELTLLNEHDEIDVDIQMVMVPSAKVRIAIRKL